MKTQSLLFVPLFIILLHVNSFSQNKNKAVFIILDGIPADVLESVETPVLDEISKEGGYTRAWLGGEAGCYSESPTVSAVGYNHLLTSTWSNKHNVYGNGIKDPNYHYWNIFRVLENANPDYHTAIFSTWLDNRTKLIGEGLEQAGNVKLDYSFDGFEVDEKAFPHDDERTFIFNIDEHVSKEAGRYIAENGPDLSWVYLEFTDDMGHKFGDSPQMVDAVQKADVQVGRVWQAIKEREKIHGENWMIVVTTDHGRDAATGKNHGGHSKRERTIWIVTNYSDLNQRFRQNPAMVDIMPSILRFMNVKIPEPTLKEIDGVPFVGDVSICNARVTYMKNRMHVTWDVLDPEGKVEVWVSRTNHFMDGKPDSYLLLGSAEVADGEYYFDIDDGADFYKILLKAPYNRTNYWWVKKK